MFLSFRQQPFAVVRQRLRTPRRTCRAPADEHRRVCIAPHRLWILWTVRHSARTLRLATLPFVTRRVGFEERLSAIHHAAREPRKFVIRPSEIGIAVGGVDLIISDGTPLLRGVAFAAGGGRAVLISGPEGAEKSTLLRTIAGIWLYGRGEIRLPSGRIPFVPQRPYLAMGTVAAALLYPGGHSKSVSTKRLATTSRSEPET